MLHDFFFKYNYLTAWFHIWPVYIAQVSGILHYSVYRWWNLDKGVTLGSRLKDSRYDPSSAMHTLAIITQWVGLTGENVLKQVWEPRHRGQKTGNQLQAISGMKTLGWPAHFTVVLGGCSYIACPSPPPLHSVLYDTAFGINTTSVLGCLKNCL